MAELEALDVEPAFPRKRIGPDLDLIDEGESEHELWSIFGRIGELELVRGGDEIIFDLTHGLRSLPLAGLLAAAFFQEVRPDVIVSRVLYGAFETPDGDGAGDHFLSQQSGNLIWRVALPRAR